MTYTAPIDPPADGNPITRAFYITYVKDNIGHLRGITGGDPGSANLVLVSSGATTAAWSSTLSIAGAAISGDLTVSGNTAFGSTNVFGTLSVSGATAIAGALSSGGISAAGSITSTSTIVATGQITSPAFNASDPAGFVFTSTEGGGTDAFYESGSHTPAIKVSNVQIQRWLAGTTIITAATQITGQVTITGSGTYTGTWAAASDQRLKSQVAAVTDGLAKVMALKPITYRQSALYRRLYGNREDSNKRYQGFIAQDVAQVFPDVVVENQDDNGMLAVDYGRLVVPLVAAVQDLKAENNALAARVVALEARP